MTANFLILISLICLAAPLIPIKPVHAAESDSFNSKDSSFNSVKPVESTVSVVAVVLPAVAINLNYFEPLKPEFLSILPVKDRKIQNVTLNIHTNSDSGLLYWVKRSSENYNILPLLINSFHDFATVNGNKLNNLNTLSSRNSINNREYSIPRNFLTKQENSDYKDTITILASSNF